MNHHHKRRLWLWFYCLLCLGGAAALTLYALSNHIDLFYSPTQFLEKMPTGHLRLGGMVVQGSVQRGDALWVEFEITDYKNTLTVQYEGILPDLFKEGQGVVTLGEYREGVFKADEVLAKHDENYMPPEVKRALDGK